MYYPEFDRVVELAEHYNVIPVSMEVHDDMEKPISLFKRFDESRFCFLLESIEGGEKWARYSIIGRNPFLIVKSYKNRTLIDSKAEGRKEVEGNPVEIIRNIMEKFNGANLPYLPSYRRKVGYFGYDLIRYYEKLPNMPR